MNWITLAIAETMLWAASNLVDERLVRREHRSTLHLVTVTALFGAAPALVLAFTGTLHGLTATTVGLGALAGVVSLAVYYPYLRALEFVHPATALLLWNIAPVLVAVLAFLMLNERLAVSGYAAIGLLTASASVATITGTPRGRAGFEPVVWMALASVLTALEAVLEKALFERTSTEAGIALMSAASGIVGMALLAVQPSMRRFWREGRLAALVASNEVLNLAASVVTSIAISQGPVSLVKAIEGTQPLFVLALAKVFT